MESGLGMFKGYQGGEFVHARLGDLSGYLLSANNNKDIHYFYEYFDTLQE